MVVHEPGDWLAESLQSVVSQTYAALQMLVLVTGQETDELAGTIRDRISTEAPNAVVRFLGGNPGYSGACNSVLDLVQGDSGLFCFMHDDVVLAPDAVARLVDEVYRSNAGVVGPKIVHWDNSQMIQSVGIAVDRFGVELPFADDGELDQEQHDSVQDVFVVPSSCVMIRADLFRTIGGFNQELSTVGADLDLCWRAHATGSRVLVVPSAMARHRESMNVRLTDDERDEVNAESELVRVRTVASLTSIGQLPFTMMQLVGLTVLRFILLTMTGRLRRAVVEAQAVLTLPLALPGIRERREALSKYRRVDGDEIRALQLRGSSYVTAWARQRARKAGLAQASAPSTVREATPKGAYVLWSILALILLIGSRSLLLNGVTAVGQMNPFGATGRQLASSYVSGWWGAGFGQVSALPTGMALTAAANVLTLGNIGLLHTLSVVLLPLIGWLGAWRFASVMGTRAARIAATATYAAVPLPYASIAAGRWGAVLIYALLPWMVHLSRMLVGLADLSDTREGEPIVLVSPATWRRWFASLTLLVAITFAFEPSIVLVLPFVGVLVAVSSLAHGLKVRWVVRWVFVIASSVACGVVLNLPWSGSYVRSGWWEAITGAPVQTGRNVGLISLARFEVGSFSLSILCIALYASVVGALFLVRGVRTGWALRGATLVVLGMLVALLDDKSLIPVHLPEPAILLTPVAFGLAICASTMGASLAVDLRRGRFSWRQPLSALVAVAFSIGLFPVAANSLNGSWNQPSIALPQLLAQLPDAQSGGQYRTLFIGDARVLPGAPLNFGWGIAYSVVNGSVPSEDDMWEAPPTRARDNAVAAMYGIVRGQTARAGRLLAPLSVRFIVVPIIDGGASTRSKPIAAPRSLVDSLSRQLDLRRRYASPDLVIFENTSWVPLRSVLTESGAASSKLAGATSMIATNIGGASAFGESVRPESSTSGQVQPSTVHLGVPYTSRWKLTANGQNIAARPAFGLTNAYDIPTESLVTLTFQSSVIHMALILVQFVVWCVVAFIAFSRRRNFMRRLNRNVSNGQLQLPVISMQGPQS